MNSKRDKFLTEAMGKCYPDWKEDSKWDGIERNYFNRCTLCGLDEYTHKLKHPTIDFSTWEGFGKLYEWVLKKNSDCDEYEEWAQRFLFSLQIKCLSIGYYVNVIPQEYINPEKFANIIFKYLKEQI